jgi:hypothetical protein
LVQVQLEELEKVVNPVKIDIRFST